MAKALSREWALLALALLALVAAVAAWVPSSYGVAARQLGVARSGPFVGEAQPVRSDEWGVLTPYFQIAVDNDLGPRNEASPYREPLKAFFALPSRDWSMTFKPDLWGFLVLDPAHAYALHYVALALAMVAGFAVLLRQLGCSRNYAAAIGLLLFLSQFVQAWWTNNAASFAFAPWPAVAFLWAGPAWARLPLIAYVTAVWLIGLLYPPFIIAAGLGLAVLIAAFRPEALRARRLLPAAAAAAAGVAVAWAHFADLIPVMAGTVYPGERVSGGGGVPSLQLAAHLWPSLVTARTEPLPLWPTNACEIAVVGSFLPLALACFGDHRAIAGWCARHRRAVATWLAGLGLMLAWMLARWPAELAPGLNHVQPNRLLWGFGLTLLLGLAVIGSHGSWRVAPWRVAAFASLVIAGWATSKLALSRQPLALGRFDVAILPILALLLVAARSAPRRLPPRRLVLAAVVLTAAVTFGRFNPVQSANPIFEDRPSPVKEALNAYAAANPHRMAVAPQHYAAVLPGVGVPSLNHVLVRPQPAFFRQAFPELDDRAFDAIFNRYAHIKPEVRWAPAVLQADLIAVPPDAFAIPLPVTVGAAPLGGRAATVERVSTVDLGGGRRGLVAEGWAPWSGVRAGQALAVDLVDATHARIVRATAFRLSRPDIVISQNRPDAYAAGFGLRLVIEGAGAASGRPPALRVTAIDDAAELRASR